MERRTTFGLRRAEPFRRSNHHPSGLARLAYRPFASTAVPQQPRWPSRLLQWTASTSSLPFSRNPFDLVYTSLGKCSAIDNDLASRHIGGVVRSQKENQRNDLIHGAQSAERHSLEPPRQGRRIHRGVDHLRINRSGMDGVAANVVLRVLSGCNFRENSDCGFAGCIGGFLVRRLSNSSNGGDVYNGAAAAALHRRDRMLGAEESAARIHGHDTVPV